MRKVTKNEPAARKINRSTNGRVVKTSNIRGRLTVTEVRKAVESVSRRKG